MFAANLTALSELKHLQSLWLVSNAQPSDKAKDVRSAIIFSGAKDQRRILLKELHIIAHIQDGVVNNLITLLKHTIQLEVLHLESK